MYYFDFENPVYEMVGEYNNEYIQEEERICQIHPWPVLMSNIKYYNTVLTQEESLKECVKYTTTHENCIINDLARQVTSGHGYAVK
jgi:hypothetical protein